MRFNLERGDAFRNNKYSVTVRINDREKINLPSNSYNYNTYDSDHFLLSIFKCNTKAILDNLSQGLELKSNYYKLDLVNSSNHPYYYYKIDNRIHIGTINDIPQEAKEKGQIPTFEEKGQIPTFDVASCSKNSLPLENSRVLIDPKDIISSKNISLILEELERRNGKLEIRIGKIFIGPWQIYNGSLEVYNIGNKIGTLNNIIPYFEQENYRYLQVSLLPFDISFTSSYFTAKKLGHNYVGCISDENGECRRFYELNPGDFGYEHDSSPSPYPYYYNLENFGNFLEVDVKIQEYINLETRIVDLEREIKNLKQYDVPSQSGFLSPSGPKGEPGHPGGEGRPGLQGLVGTKGERGWVGGRGSPGLKGGRGPQGPVGTKGNPGPRGLNGKKGDTGDQGPEGKKREPGTLGEKGDKGDTPSATEIATELVTSEKAKLGKAVLDAEDSSGKNLVTQIAGEVVKLSPQDFVNKVDATKLTEGVVHKLSPEKAKKIVEDIVNAITSDATKKNNPDPSAFKEYEKFAEKLAELLVNRSNISNIDTNTLVENKVSNWALAKYLLLYSNLNEQEKARHMVEQEIDKEKLAKYLIEYTKLEGDVDKARTIVESIVNNFFNTKIDELGKAVLEAKDNQDKKILVNDPALQKGVAEELRKNPGQIKGENGAPGDKGDTGLVGSQGPVGPKGDMGNIGAPGPQGLVGPRGFNGTQGIQGPKGADGTSGSKGDIGPQGVDGAPGDKGDTGLVGSQGPVGPKGDMGNIGAPGPQGLVGPRGFNGTQGIQGPKGADGTSGSKGDIGPVGPQGVDGAPGDKGDTGPVGPKGEPGMDGIGADVANQFLHEIKKTKNETLDAKKAAEVAKNASESFAKEAKSSKDKVTELHAEVVNSTKRAETASKDAGKFAGKALQSARNAEAFSQSTEGLYSKTRDIFCRTSPADQVCTARRKKRETKNLNNQPVTSGAGRPSSWINVFTNTIVGAITGAFQPVSSFKPAIDSNNSQPSKAITTQGIDINGTLSLLDVFIRKITGQKYISTAEQPASPSETLGYSLQIAEEFEEVLKYAAVKSGISVKKLSFNPVSVQSAITKHINEGQYSKIPKILYSSAKEACPNSKQTDKFLAIFKDRMERTLANNEQLSNTKEIVTGNEQPRSFMSDVVSPSSLSTINHKAVGYLR